MIFDYELRTHGVMPPFWQAFLCGMTLTWVDFVCATAWVVCLGGVTVLHRSRIVYSNGRVVDLSLRIPGWFR